MENNIIPKAELKHGHWYLNKNSGRGMRIGMWEANKQRFLCIKGPKFGMYDLYMMEHTEDDAGFTIFEPIVDISEQIENVHPTSDGC